MRIEIPRDEYPGGHYGIYLTRGARRDPTDFLSILSILEAENGRVDSYTRNHLKEGDFIEAYKGLTRQGFKYGYYEYLTEPSQYLMGIAIPDGTLVIDGGGYVRFDTIPGSLTYTPRH